MAKKFYEYGPNDEVVSKVKSVGGAAPSTDQNGEVDLSSLFTSANTSLVAVCREYGGAQIKQDENGNFYYEVEVED